MANPNWGNFPQVLDPHMVELEQESDLEEEELQHDLELQKLS